MVLGTVSDTILALALTDGLLTAYVDRDESGRFEEAYSVQLPEYFQPPPVSAEIVNYPWIHFGGDQIKLIEARPIRSGTFGPFGKTFVIRNYSARWHGYRDKIFSIDGGWEVTDPGLEVYDRRGRLLGAWELPDPTATWIRVDVNHRILVGSAKGLWVIQDPTAPKGPCPPQVSEIMITATDLPLPLEEEDVNRRAQTR